MKLACVFLLLFFIGCSSSEKKEEFTLDSEAPSTTANEPELVQKGDVGKDTYTISPAPNMPDAAAPTVSDPEASPQPMAVTSTITSNKKGRKNGSMMTLTKKCKIRAKASTAGRVTKKMRKGQSIAVSSAGKVWYKVSTGGYIAKSCFK